MKPKRNQIIRYKDTENTEIEKYNLIDGVESSIQSPIVTGALQIAVVMICLGFIFSASAEIIVEPVKMAAQAFAKMFYELAVMIKQSIPTVLTICLTVCFFKVRYYGNL